MDLTIFCAGAPEPELALARICLDLLAAAGASDFAGGTAKAEAELTAAAAGVPAAPAALVGAVLNAVVAGGDPLGDTFCALRSPTDRRARGQFYTPALIVESMCAWALAGAPVRAVDAGCGSGRYAAALRRAGFAGQLVAADADPLATLMCRAHLAAAGFAGMDTTVVCGSFLDLELPAVSGMTAWVGNPPYLRHHNLTAETKAWAKAAGAALGVPVSGLAGLHALFFLAVAAHGRPGDVGTFITSSEWFDARYGSLVRTLLAGTGAGRLPLARMDVVDPAAAVFDDATTTAAVTCFTVAGNQTASAGDEPALVRHVHEAAELAVLHGGIALPRTRLAERARWSDLLVESDTTAEGMVALGQHMRVSRGVATGANDFFTMTAQQAAARELDRWARPLVGRAAEVIACADTGVLAAGAPRKVVLELPDAGDDNAVAAWVADGQGRGVHEGYINASRATWYRLTLPEPPAAFATYMARQAPVFAVNAAGAHNLNSVHGLRPRPGFPTELVPVLIDWLNAHRDSLVGGRTYAGGLRKIEPRDMEGFLVPDVPGLRAWAAERAVA